MKNLFKLSLGFAVLFGAFACDKVIDRDSEMSATVDGNSFNALLTIGVEKSGIVVVTGSVGKENLVVAMNKDLPEGDYDMISGKAYVTYATAEKSFSVTTSGTVSITNNDIENKQVEGTFSGIIRTQGDSTSTIEIKNGKFFSSYTSQ